MRLSAHFTLAELTRSDTATRLKLNNKPIGARLDRLYLLADRMEKVREVLGNKPILVTSGYRSAAVNKAVGGVPNSDHTLGNAIDFKCPAFGTPYEICKAIIASPIAFDQLIQERRKWVHISFGPKFRGEVLTLPPVGNQYLKGLHE